MLGLSHVKHYPSLIKHTSCNSAELASSRSGRLPLSCNKGLVLLLQAISQLQGSNSLVCDGPLDNAMLSCCEASCQNLS